MNKPCMRWRVICSVSILLIPLMTPAQETPRQVDAAALTSDIEHAVAGALDKCTSDIQQYCGDVTPGEGRLLGCLQAYSDQVSEECQRSLGSWQAPSLVLDFQSTQIYPTLEYRELGEPNVDSDGERVIWKYRLPFLAQQVIDLGFELPNPYGVAIIPADGGEYKLGPSSRRVGRPESSLRNVQVCKAVYPGVAVKFVAPYPEVQPFYCEMM